MRVALLLGLLVAPIAAHAESAQDAAFAAQVFGKAPAKAPMSTCFARAYDTAHLSEHPQQNVRTMTMLVSTQLDDDGARTYGVRLNVQFRSSNQSFRTQGSCGAIHADGETAGSGKQINCGVDCDGGAIDVALRDANSVLVTIPDGAQLWTPNGNDANVSGRKKFGKDDKLFRLDRANLSQCLPMVGDAQDRRQLGIPR